MRKPFTVESSWPVEADTAPGEAGHSGPARRPASPDRADRGVEDIRRRTVQGALVSVAAQATASVLRLAAIMIMSRLLGPEDFGLFGMVTAFTGFLHLFRD